MPIVSQVCQMPSVTQIQSSHYNNNPVDAANMLANSGIIASHVDTPANY